MARRTMNAPSSNAKIIIAKLPFLSNFTVVSPSLSMRPSWDSYTGTMRPRLKSTITMMRPITTLIMKGFT